MTFDGNLVGDLLYEVREQAGALPLLQFTLDQLFEQRKDHLLTQKAYQEIGGVKGALSKHAEKTYLALPTDTHREAARTLFLRLIDPGITEQDTTRRRASITELVFADAQQTALVQEARDVFVNARLLTANASGKRETTIEVSHEALIREWPRLVDWLHTARDDIRLQHIMHKDVTEWNLRKRPSARLYRGIQLKEAEDWAKRNKPNEQEAAFLHASVTRRVFSLVSLVVVALLVLSSAGVAGWFFLTRPADPTLVTTLADNINGGSLRYCIDDAPSGSTIHFAKGLKGTIQLTGDLTFLSGRKLTLVGPGAGQLAISGGDSNTHVHVPRNSTVDISGLSFKNSETRGDAFLFNEGTLTVSKSIISDNKNIVGDSALGGGIENKGTLSVNNSVISSNIQRAVQDRMQHILSWRRKANSA